LRKLTIILLIALVTLEFFLRGLGLHTPPLYISSKTFQYIYAPNQDVSRFGNNILTNSFSQRSAEPKKNAIKILKIGDSIINGGSPTDHNELSSSILSESLSKEFDSEVQVLNISAGSWGPDNGCAYLKEQGNFDAKIMVLVFSSHDLHDIKNESTPVGKSINYPDKNPPFAIYELLERYILKRKLNLSTSENNFKSLQIEKSTDENPGFQQLIDFGKLNEMNIIAYLHPTQKELAEQHYNNNGKRILDIWNNNGIAVLKGIDYLDKSCYRDDIHLNAQGQRVMAEAILPELLELVGRVE